MIDSPANIFDERRAQLLADATNPVSRAILDAMPRMVSHPIPQAHMSFDGRDVSGWCAQDFDLRGALGCTPGEGYILNRAATLAKPRFMLEIGSYF